MTEFFSTDSDGIGIVYGLLLPEVEGNTEGFEVYQHHYLKWYPAFIKACKRVGLHVISENSLDKESNKSRLFVGRILYYEEDLTIDKVPFSAQMCEKVTKALETVKPLLEAAKEWTNNPKWQPSLYVLKTSENYGYSVELNESTIQSK